MKVKSNTLACHHKFDSNTTLHSISNPLQNQSSQNIGVHQATTLVNPARHLAAPRDQSEEPTKNQKECAEKKHDGHKLPMK